MQHRLILFILHLAATMEQYQKLQRLDQTLAKHLLDFINKQG